MEKISNLYKIGYILVFIFIGYCNCNAQQANPLFAIRPAAKAWLNYYYYWVPFDSSVSGYSFGEVKLINGSDTTWINLAQSIPNDSIVYADTNRGSHPELASLSHTDTFTIPSSGSISFYRQIKNDNYSPYYSSDTAIGNHLGWHITDTTQFNLYLVRNSDNAILATLDSVGTFAKTSYLFGDVRFGTQPQNIVITRTLPSGYAGTTAYLEIMPTWNGTNSCTCCTGGGGISPANFRGMPFKRSPYYMNVSAMYDSLGNNLVTSDALTNWAAQKYTQIIAYCDSVKGATGCVSGLPLPFDSVAQRTRFWQRYAFKPVVLTNGDTTYLDTACMNHPIILGKKISYKDGNLSISIPDANLSNILKITSVAFGADQNSVRLSVQSSSDIPGASVAIACIDGRAVGGAWNGNISKGSNNVSVALPRLPSDAYMIYILVSGVITGSAKIIVVR